MSTKENISDYTLDVLSPTIRVFEQLVIIYNWIVYTVVCQLIVFFGIGTNIINIICFVKQGFKDPINVSLLGLTVADLGSLTTLICTILCMNPAFSASDLPFEPLEFQYLVTGMAHSTFTRITGWITALITLERCLCITAPLKVKSIITTPRVCIVVAGIYTIIISSGSPVYVVNTLGFKFYPGRNKTLIGLIYLGQHDRVENISYIINNTFLPFCSFVVITVSTIVLTCKLHKKMKWRKKSVTAAQADSVASRNQRIAKMVVMISVIFIICFVPICLIFLVMTFNSDFSITGKYKNIVFMIGGVGLVLESINSSVNIFIYYSMSSKYRVVFRKLFCMVRTPIDD